MTRLTAKGTPDKRVKVKRDTSAHDGRPGKPVDWNKVDDLLTAGCTGAEVAAYFDMHPRTFCIKVEDKYGMTFTAYSAEKKANGEALLRAHQYAKALGYTKEGDNTLLIWLGKQRLNQSESPTELSINENTMKSFNSLMNQLDSLQSNCNIEESRINAEQKS